jgi:hypothetical protein
LETRKPGKQESETMAQIVSNILIAVIVTNIVAVAGLIVGFTVDMLGDRFGSAL